MSLVNPAVRPLWMALRSVFRSSRALRFLVTLVIALAGTLPLARAQTTARSAEPAIAAASVRWACTGRCTGFTTHPYVVDPARAECHNCGTWGMVLFAFGLNSPTQIEGAPEWMSQDRYDLEIVSTSPVSRSQMDQILLRRVLEQCFSLRTSKVTKAVPGYALVVAPGGVKFPAVKEKPSDRPEEGITHLATLSQLVSVLNQYYYHGKRSGVTRPVRDATGLHGLYSIPFPFAPEPGTNLLAVLGPLGLRVKPDQGTETRLQILHIDHLRTNWEVGSAVAPQGR